MYISVTISSFWWETLVQFSMLKNALKFFNALTRPILFTSYSLKYMHVNKNPLQIIYFDEIKTLSWDYITLPNEVGGEGGHIKKFSTGVNGFDIPLLSCGNDRPYLGMEIAPWVGLRWWCWRSRDPGRSPRLAPVRRSMCACCGTAWTSWEDCVTSQPVLY